MTDTTSVYLRCEAAESEVQRLRAENDSYRRAFAERKEMFTEAAGRVAELENIIRKLGRVYDEPDDETFPSHLAYAVRLANGQTPGATASVGNDQTSGTASTASAIPQAEEASTTSPARGPEEAGTLCSFTWEGTRCTLPTGHVGAHHNRPRPSEAREETIECADPAEISRRVRQAYEDGASFRSGADNAFFRSEVFVYPDGRIVKFKWEHRPNEATSCSCGICPECREATAPPDACPDNARYEPQSVGADWTPIAAVSVVGNEALVELRGRDGVLFAIEHPINGRRREALVRLDGEKDCRWMYTSQLRIKPLQWAETARADLEHLSKIANAAAEWRSSFAPSLPNGGIKERLARAVDDWYRFHGRKDMTPPTGGEG